MEYIVLDLEWNSVYFKPQNRFINEIIQIGAVKLNSALEIIDVFQSTVRSAVSKKLSNRVISLTGITNEQMLSGVSFRDAVKAYNEWVGEDAITMTWSNSDLYAIVENSRTFLTKNETLKITKYLDLQSYIQAELRILGFQITNQISLATAAELLNISTDKFDLHTARDDAFVCALMFKNCFNENKIGDFIKDTTESSFYDRLFFKPYCIINLNDKRINKNHLKFECNNCSKAMNRLKRWKQKNNWFRSEFYCENCNITNKCMVSFKQTYDKVVVKKRMLPIKSAQDTSEDMAMQ